MKRRMCIFHEVLYVDGELAGSEQVAYLELKKKLGCRNFCKITSETFEKFLRISFHLKKNFGHNLRTGMVVVIVTKRLS